MMQPPIQVTPDEWQIVQDLLAKHVAQYPVWAFGSRATGCAKKYSDLDLVIITDTPIALSLQAALSEDFSESNLPWKVDILDWSMLSPSFQEIIERHKVMISAG